MGSIGDAAGGKDPATGQTACNSAGCLNIKERMRGREQVKNGLVLVERIQPGGPCDGVGIAIGDAIRFVDGYRVYII